MATHKPGCRQSSTTRLGSSHSVLRFCYPIWNHSVQVCHTTISGIQSSAQTRDRSALQSTHNRSQHAAEVRLSHKNPPGTDHVIAVIDDPGACRTNTSKSWRRPHQILGGRNRRCGPLPSTVSTCETLASLSQTAATAAAHAASNVSPVNRERGT